VGQFQAYSSAQRFGPIVGQVLVNALSTRRVPLLLRGDINQRLDRLARAAAKFYGSPSRSRRQTAPSTLE
jgi:hypothetical protein